jgi:divalent metal cation (Fe/Co/Zn/Cd) transporter
VQVSDKPADEDHTYGHGKIENLSAFGEALLMAVSCVWIIWEAMQRIFTHTVELHHSVWPVLVLLTSIGVDYWRSRQLQAGCPPNRLARSRHRRIPLCQDIWATVAVLAGPGRSWIGLHYGLAGCAMPTRSRPSWFRS